MGAFSHRGWQQWGLAVFVGSAGWLSVVGAPAQRPHAPITWDAAVQARTEFEAEPAGTHTRAEYARVMDGFRAIYHANPADARAPRAVQQVAELLAEQGRELGDAKSLKDAAGQYDFLLAQYPMSSAARESRGKADELRAADAAPLHKEPHTKQEAPAQVADVVPADAAPASDDHYHPPSHTHVAPAQAVEPVTTPAIDAATAPDTGSHKMAVVSGVRYWSTPTYTRVAIDLGDEVTYQAARVEHPDRIYFDLHHSRLAHELSGKSFNVTDDSFLTRIRAAQFSNDITRVVLDVHEVTEYSAFLLPNPYRLIIDIHGKQADASAPTSAPAAPAENPPADTPKPAPHESEPATASGPVSSLPPMAVTDGSAGFGLPSKRAENTASKPAESAVAQPRVVIPSRPTAQKPVPNTVVQRSVETGTEVAAVSSQPGRVDATSRPTSAPIVDKAASRHGTSRRDSSAAEFAHTPGAPAEVAPPTADGQTSLMRALGLKIGRIVIDAGHGGHDSGTLGADGIEEKDVALDVALRLGKLLHDRLGAEIVYTRADDTFIPLETRTAIANKAQADLFISVHCNSSQDASARGVEVYYLNFTSDPDAMRVASRENAVSSQSVHELSDLVKKIALKDKIDESRELASDVDESLYSGLTKGNAGLKNRGVKKAPFVVLIGANMPSILAEISFVTNPQDASQLRTPDYRQRVAESLFKGVQRYEQAINGSHPQRQQTTERASR